MFLYLISFVLFHSTDHYNGYVEFNDEPYDSSRLRGRPDVKKLGEWTKTSTWVLSILWWCNGFLWSVEKKVEHEKIYGFVKWTTAQSVGTQLLIYFWPFLLFQMSYFQGGKLVWAQWDEEKNPSFSSLQSTALKSWVVVLECLHQLLVCVVIVAPQNWNEQGFLFYYMQFYCRFWFKYFDQLIG